MRGSRRSRIGISPRPGCIRPPRRRVCSPSTAPGAATTPASCGLSSWPSCGRNGGMWNSNRAPGGPTPGPCPGVDVTRDEALQLMQEHPLSPSLRQHMLAVEAAMRAHASKSGGDPETWGIVGLLHDFDYEKFPNNEHSATEGHPAWGVRLLRERGLPDAMCRAILGHATYTGVPRDTPLAKALFAVDELCGFLVACALVRPSRSFADLEVASVKKKLKDTAFARGVSRDEVRQVAEELGVPLDDHITFVIQALRPVEGALGLGSGAGAGAGAGAPPGGARGGEGVPGALGPAPLVAAQRRAASPGR